MKFILKENHYRLSDKDLIDDLRKTSKKFNRKYVSALEYDKHGKYRASTLTRRFGSWNASLIKAGLKIKVLSHIPDDELMLNLKRVWEKLGRQPAAYEMVKPLSEYRSGIYQRRYGSWYAALRIFSAGANRGMYKTAKQSRMLQLKTNFRKRKRKYFSKGTRYNVMMRDKFKCRLCGASPASNPGLKLHIDHIIPLSKGGSNNISNLQTLCSDCNLGKGTKLTTNK